MLRIPSTAVLLSTLCFAASAQEQPVVAKEIQETWTGKTLVGTTVNGAPTSMAFGADGNAQLSAGNTRDSGTWRVSEQGYCTTWKTIRAGQERCFTVRRVGGRMVVYNPDGSVSGQFTDIR